MGRVVLLSRSWDCRYRVVVGVVHIAFNVLYDILGGNCFTD